MKRALITGSGGLIGSEAARFFCREGFSVIGVDNNMREYFFGPDGSTDSMMKKLADDFKDFKAVKADIRDAKAIEKIFQEHGPFEIVIHTAAQPSHDWAAREPMTDFGVNAVGTLTILETTRKHSPDAVFIFTSTNKVYGDRPNSLPFVEQETRWEIKPGHHYEKGIDESMSIDSTLHSVFGASKVAADVMVQEYGRYFGMKTAVFRGGCLTGPFHRGVELHGFLNYLVKCAVSGKPYHIFGYKGKQVRDNIHSHDLINAFYEFYKEPRSGEIYNIGGSRYSNCSMLEAFAKVEAITGKKAVTEYFDEPRKGDHIWYISDVSKFQSHYPGWKYEYDIDGLIEELVRAAMAHANAMA
jgi:CDP-paratose 2-epimerase